MKFSEKLHERVEAIRARHARLATSPAVPDKSAPAFGTDDTGELLVAIDRLTMQCAALASVAERRAIAIKNERFRVDQLRRDLHEAQNEERRLRARLHDAEKMGAMLGRQ